MHSSDCPQVLLFIRKSQEKLSCAAAAHHFPPHKYALI